MGFILGLYLVGYFISFGISFGMKEEKDSWWDTFGFACFLGLLSWINIGLAIGDYFKKHFKDDSKINITNEQHPLR